MYLYHVDCMIQWYVTIIIYTYILMINNTSFGKYKRTGNAHQKKHIDLLNFNAILRTNLVWNCDKLNCINWVYSHNSFWCLHWSHLLSSFLIITKSFFVIDTTRITGWCLIYDILFAINLNPFPLLNSKRCKYKHFSLVIGGKHVIFQVYGLKGKGFLLTNKD